MSLERPWYTKQLSVLLETYPNLGIGSVPWNNSTHPSLYAVKDDIISRFNTEYGQREIGSETNALWQTNVDRVFNRIKDTYDYKFSMYSEYEDTLKAIGRKITTTSNAIYQDTPVTVLTGNYATNKNDSTTVMEISEGMDLEEIYAMFNVYEDLKSQFIKEFDICFINVIARV